MKKLKFEWYVMNEDVNRRDIKPFNIFRNWPLNDAVNELCEQYKKENMSFEAFTEELRHLIMWQEWARCEYEVMIGGLFDKLEDFKKIDCYQQALPNIKIIAKYCLEEYYPDLKINLNTKEDNEYE